MKSTCICAIVFGIHVVVLFKNHALDNRPTTLKTDNGKQSIERQYIFFNQNDE
jgi:hypothetical protein